MFCPMGTGQVMAPSRGSQCTGKNLDFGVDHMPSESVVQKSPTLVVLCVGDFWELYVGADGRNLNECHLET